MSSRGKSRFMKLWILDVMLLELISNLWFSQLIIDKTKNVTLLGGRLSPNSYIIWSDFTQSRFFSHFRYFWGENHKRSNFGRFWSEKVRKTTKSQKTMLWIVADGVTTYKVTASSVNEVKNEKNTRDGPVSFWLSLATASRLAVKSGIVPVTTSRMAIKEP